MTQETGPLDKGLALSGGGFRATLFHLGSLLRLNELGWLKQLDIITSVSGGSILSGVLALHWKELVFRNDIAVNFMDVVGEIIREFCKNNIDVVSGLEGIISIFESIPDRVGKEYDKHLFSGSTLQDLPDHGNNEGPRFIFYATSLQTGSSVRFCRERLADYKIGEISSPNVPLATAVAASSAFPPFLSPQVLKTDPDSWAPLEGAFLYDHPELRRSLILCDGGVYDNLGLETIDHRCRTVLVSDAGAPLQPDAEPGSDWLKQTLRVLDIVSDQTRALRKRALIADFKKQVRGGTYWGIRTRIKDYDLADTLIQDSPLTESLQHIRTRLNSFTDDEQEHLINWGYALTDAAMRKHVLTGAFAPGRLPFPQEPLQP